MARERAAYTASDPVYQPTLRRHEYILLTPTALRTATTSLRASGYMARLKTIARSKAKKAKVAAKALRAWAKEKKMTKAPRVVPPT